ncbi:MAG TPA: zinc-ribbon and DUF3426 domain-containing protein [Burkholderiales bacterium]
MSLVTRCPVCATSFSVQRAQLAAHGGTVRCGKCAAVFDGVAGLVEEGAESLSLEPSPQLGLFDPSRKPQAVAGDDGPLPPFLDERHAGPRRTWLWTTLAALAALALAGQTLHRFRAEIGAGLPEARAPLAAACRLFGCEVPLPRRPDLMSIDSSELQTDARREDVIVLNAVIRNRARFPQDYPSLELTLTDEAEHPVLRRVLAPRDYLDTGRAAAMIAQGIPESGEVPLKVFLYAERVRATGYRLYLFFPQ